MATKKYSLGWVRDSYDPRDRIYAVNPEVLSALPAVVDLRNRFKTKPFDQGNIGSCTAQAAAGDLLFDEEQTPNSDVLPSRLFIYYTTRTLMGTVNQDSGATLRDVCKAANQFGWPSETSWPYVTAKYKEKPPQAVYDEAATRKVMRYERVTQDINQMKGALASGDPFLFGFEVFQSMMTTQVGRTGVIPMPMPNERPIGGHAVLLVGYMDDKQQFVFRNSWGSWGDAGYGYIPFSYATNSMLAADFWTLHWDEAVVPPIPSPGKKFAVKGTNLIIDSDSLIPIS